MKKQLITNGDRWYKANLHCHSTVSDGKMTVEALAEAYRKEGYQIVAFTDHRKLIPHPELNREDFLALTSVELDGSDRRDENKKYRPTYHLNFFARKADETDLSFYDQDYMKKHYGPDAWNELIAKVSDRFLVQYNHPRWSLQDIRDFGPLEGLWGFEVFNTGCEEVMLNGWGEEEYIQMLREGKMLIPTATDDNHDTHPIGEPKNDSFGGFTMIQAKALTQEAVIAAMEKGDCYASTGPVIKELWAEDGVVHAETSGVCCICLRGPGYSTKHERAHGDTLTHAEFELSAFKEVPEFLYLEVADTYGKKAITRAFLQQEWEE
ncbi:MAG: PHP domain-containing protein [Clostridia bacterium]|nr:PHP domain-containing protein [Clostridia bacterium]